MQGKEDDREEKYEKGDLAPPNGEDKERKADQGREEPGEKNQVPPNLRSRF